MYWISPSFLVISIAPFETRTIVPIALYLMFCIENSQKNLPSQKIHNYSKSFEKGKERKMKDLSREERLNQRIAELERQIYVKDDAFDKEQGKRCKRTFLVLSGVIFLSALYFGLELKMIDISYCLMWLVLAPISAGVMMYISLLITLYIYTGATRRVETIAKLKGELNTLKSEKNNNYLDEKTKELKERIELLERIQEKLAEENAYLRLSKLLDDEVEKNEQD